MESKTIIPRAVFNEAKLLATQFRALAIVGPRQSGKTTLCGLLFPKKAYVSFENPSVQAAAEMDPTEFLAQFPDGAILDEVQRVPIIFRHLQGILDKSRERGQFILTGSNHFLLQQEITQSLAGRIGYVQLLPLSFAELQVAGLESDTVHKHILTGGYPEIWQEKLIPDKWMSAYVQTYVQRDVRQIRNISNLGDFTRFLMLCASYAGQLVNRENFAKSIGVDTKTIQAWFGVLESSYIIYMLQPWYNNLNKRIVKSPKIYFYDTGLLCHLLNITSAAQLSKHQRYGSIFENWIITEIIKNQFNRGNLVPPYFFRDSTGNEVDLLMEKDGDTLAIEIKAAGSFSSSQISGLKYWLRNNREAQTLLINGGKKSQELDSQISIEGWQKVANL